MSATLGAVWASKALWALHVVANAVVIAAIYGWLWIPDRTVTDLLLSMVAGTAIVMFTSWLHSGTLEYFRITHADGRSGRWSSFKPSARRVAVFAVWVIVLCAAILLALQLRQRLEPAADWLASALTFRLRRPVAPARVFGIFSTAVALLAFIVVPFLALQFWKWKFTARYFLTYVVLFVLGAYLPYKLVWWIPEFDGLYPQTISMTVRFLAAYLLAVTAWLILASVLGRLRSSSEIQGARQTAER